MTLKSSEVKNFFWRISTILNLFFPTENWGKSVSASLQRALALTPHAARLPTSPAPKVTGPPHRGCPASPTARLQPLWPPNTPANCTTSCTTPPLRRMRGAPWALQCARDCKKTWVSRDHCPPTSPAMTTKRALPYDPLNSGFLAPPCQLQSNPVHLVGLPQRCPITMMGGHQKCIQCQLHTSEDGQSLGHDLQPPCIGVAARDVEVSDHDVCGNSGSCFPADLFHSVFDRKSSPAENPCPAACCPVVAKQVKTTATHTGTHRQAQWHPQTPQKEYSEGLWLHSCHSTCWEWREGHWGQWSTLWSHRRPLWRRQKRPHHFPRCCLWTFVDATFCYPCLGCVGSLSRCLTLRTSSGLKPADNASQFGVSTSIRRNRLAASSTAWKHRDDLVAIPCTILLATSGCRILIISRQSAQLPQCAASRVISEFPMPNPPRVNGIDAATCTSEGIVSMWRTLLRQRTSCASWCLAKSWVNSGCTVLERKFAVAPAQNKMSNHATWTLGTRGIISSKASCSAPFFANCAWTNSSCPTGAPNTVNPCSVNGNSGSPLHTTASGFSILAAVVSCAAPAGSTPPRFQIWVLPWWTLMHAFLLNSCSNNLNTWSTLVGLQMT